MLLNFKKQFAPLILDGSKIHTLRKPRKHQPKIGETLYMYTGLRTGNTQLISKDHRLVSVQNVIVQVQWFMHDTWNMDKWTLCWDHIYIDTTRLDHSQCTQFALSDGFQNVHHLLMFLTKSSIRLPIASKRTKPDEFYFEGAFNLFHWTDLKY